MSCWKSASLAGKRIRFGTNRVTISEPIRVEPPEGDTVASCPTLNTYRYSLRLSHSFTISNMSQTTIRSWDTRGASETGKDGVGSYVLKLHSHASFLSPPDETLRKNDQRQNDQQTPRHPTSPSQQEIRASLNVTYVPRTRCDKPLAAMLTR
jgi:hypothetical protein